MIAKIVVCDVCLRTAETDDGPADGRTSEAARSIAAREGWVRKNKKDLCPDCLEG